MTKKRKKRHVFADILRYLGLTVLALLTGICLYSSGARFLGGDSFPMPFGYGASVVLTGSMEPAISVDDLILVKRFPTYEVNDVVVYSSRTSNVVHRIISVDGDSVTTQGDANNTADDPISRFDIKGRVILVVPYLGSLVKHLRTPGGVILLIALALAISELGYLRAKNRAEQEKKELLLEIRELKRENIGETSVNGEASEAASPASAASAKTGENAENH